MPKKVSIECLAAVNVAVSLTPICHLPPSRDHARARERRVISAASPQIDLALGEHIEQENSVLAHKLTRLP